MIYPQKRGRNDGKILPVKKRAYTEENSIFPVELYGRNYKLLCKTPYFEYTYGGTTYRVIVAEMFYELHNIPLGNQKDPYDARRSAIKTALGRRGGWAVGKNYCLKSHFPDEDKPKDGFFYQKDHFYYRQNSIVYRVPKRSGETGYRISLINYDLIAKEFKKYFFNTGFVL